MNDSRAGEKGVLEHLYREMLQIRRVEEKISELYKQGHIKAPVHLSIGQEAVAVGVISALRKSDKIVSTHRCHGHYLAKGGNLKKMLAELLGKSDGCCHGKGGTMHLFDDEAGHVASMPIVGASVPIAAGLGLSFKSKNENKISVAFMGDGAVEEGTFWESLNFVSVHNLPVLFVCENNGYATHSPILKRQPAGKIFPRVAPHGVKTFYVDNGNDALAVLHTAEEAVRLVRQGYPCFIEAVTYRWKEHWGSGEDWHLGYRTQAEGKPWMENCPVDRLKLMLLKEGVPEFVFADIEKELKLKIDEAVTFALESKPPLSDELLTDVSGNNQKLLSPKADVTFKRKISYKEAAAEAILQAMELDENVILMGEGVDNITGVYGHVLPAYAKFGSKRVIDTPLSENALTGIAIGAALEGMRPVLIHQRNDFMLLAMDQMFNQAAKLRYVSGGRHKAPVTFLSFIARKPGEGVQHSQSLQSVFAHFPGVKVGMPSSPADAKGMLLTAIFDDDPVVILEHRSLFEKSGFVPTAPYKTPYSANLVSKGGGLTIVCVSATFETVEGAVKKINNSRWLQYGPEMVPVCPDIIDLRWVRPHDVKLIINSVKHTRRLLVVDTSWVNFGVAAEVIASVCENPDINLDKTPKRIGIADAPCPASSFLEQYYHPAIDEIAKVILELY